MATRFLDDAGANGGPHQGRQHGHQHLERIGRVELAKLVGAAGLRRQVRKREQDDGIRDQSGEPRRQAEIEDFLRAGRRKAFRK